MRHLLFSGNQTRDWGGKGGKEKNQTERGNVHTGPQCLIVRKYMYVCTIHISLHQFINKAIYQSICLPIYAVGLWFSLEVTDITPYITSYISYIVLTYS